MVWDYVPIVVTTIKHTLMQYLFSQNWKMLDTSICYWLRHCQETVCAICYPGKRAGFGQFLGSDRQGQGQSPPQQASFKNPVFWLQQTKRGPTQIHYTWNRILMNIRLQNIQAQINDHYYLKNKYAMDINLRLHQALTLNIFLSEVEQDCKGLKCKN